MKSFKSSARRSGGENAQFFSIFASSWPPAKKTTATKTDSRLSLERAKGIDLVARRWSARLLGCSRGLVSHSRLIC